MNLPDWRSPELGVRVRAALWLATEVGEGNTFTSAELWKAFPGISQIDRRLRDLRAAGWEIVTSRERAELGPDERRLEKIGSPVWEPQHRAAGLRLITNAVRRQVLDRDRHRCARCGIGAGESYPDSPSAIARLVVNHVVPIAKGGTDTPENLITECARCSDMIGGHGSLSAAEIWRRIEGLTPPERVRVLAWLVRGKRDFSPAEQAFADARQLPAAERDALMDRLAGLVAE